MKREGNEGVNGCCTSPNLTRDAPLNQPLHPLSREGRVPDWCEGFSPNCAPTWGQLLSTEGLLHPHHGLNQGGNTLHQEVMICADSWVLLGS